MNIDSSKFDISGAAVENKYVYDFNSDGKLQEKTAYNDKDGNGIFEKSYNVKYSYSKADMSDNNYQEYNEATHYDADGNLLYSDEKEYIEESYYSDGSLKSKSVETEHYGNKTEYNEKGDIIKQSGYHYEVGDYESNYELEYDENGRLAKSTSKTRLSHLPDTYTSITTYEYDENGRLIKEKHNGHKSFSILPGYGSEDILYTYNDKNMVETKITDKNQDGVFNEGDIYEKFDYVYDGNGDLKSKTITKIDTKSEFNSEINEYNYQTKSNYDNIPESVLEDIRDIGPDDLKKKNIFERFFDFLKKLF